MTRLNDDDFNDVANRFYGSPKVVAHNYRSALSDSMEKLRAHYGLDSEQTAARLAEDGEFFESAELTRVAPKLHALMARHEVQPPDDATREAWSAETWRRLRETFGDDAERRLGTVNEYLNARPAVSHRLIAGGLDQHPDLILALVENAHVLRVDPGE